MSRKSHIRFVHLINFGPWLLSGFAILLTGCNRDASQADSGASPSPVSSVSTSASDSAKTLDSATASLPTSLTLSPAGGFDRIGLGPKITVAQTPEGLVIHSQTDDPQFGLTRLRPSATAKWTVHIQLSSPAVTTVEVFYNTSKAPSFDAAHSVRKPLQKGDNDVTIEFTEPDFQGGIRIDPGEVAGDYTIKLIEVWASNAADVSAPARTPSP